MTPFRSLPASPLLLIVPVLATVAAGLAWLAGPATAMGVARWPFLAIMAVNLLALSLSAWPSLLGFLVWSFGGTTHKAQASSLAAPRGRTALLFPIHNEDPHQVFAAAQVMLDAIRAASLPIELFVLSDSTDPAIVDAEQTALQALHAWGHDAHYRHRTDNTGRKAGNVADFCRRWGADYEYMIVLDADSVMTADCMGQLIAAMDASPRAALIQTVPSMVNRETLFARADQFAGRLYTPLWALGSALWQGARGNYWGHNAIVRIAPFMRHCRLPVLPGREPLGGEILCHDVVEAGMLHRAGWQVWIWPDLPGSYEEMPTNALDYYGRERRWCQGNLQHARLLARSDVGLVGKLHLLIGMLYYATGLSWLGAALLLLAVPGSEAVAPRCALLVLGLVLLPKLLGLGIALRQDRARHWGGRKRLLASALLEQALATLSAPVSLVFYARFVTTILRGRTVGWDAQHRAERSMRWSEAWPMLRGHALIGVVALAAAAWRPALLIWAVPALAGLLLATPLTLLGASLQAGRRTRRWGLFLTEDETAPAPELSAVRMAARAQAGSGMPAASQPSMASSDVTAPGLFGGVELS